MKNKNIWIVIGIILLVLYMQGGEKAMKKQASQLASCSFAESGSFILFGTYKRAQTFTVNADYDLENIIMRLARPTSSGYPPTVFLTVNQGGPDGAVIGSAQVASSTLSWSTDTVSTVNFPITGRLNNGQTYAIVVSAPGGDSTNRINIGYRNSDCYGGTTYHYYYTTGTTWYYSTSWDLYFQVYGNPAPTAPTYAEFIGYKDAFLTTPTSLNSFRINSNNWIGGTIPQSCIGTLDCASYLTQGECTSCSQCWWGEDLTSKTCNIDLSATGTRCDSPSCKETNDATFDSCIDGSLCGAEYVSNIELDKTIITTEDSITATCTFNPSDSDYDADYWFIALHDTNNDWTIINSGGPSEDAFTSGELTTRQATIDPNAIETLGTHYIRCGICYGAGCNVFDDVCPASQYSDKDDISFEVMPAGGACINNGACGDCDATQCTSCEGCSLQ